MIELPEARTIAAQMRQTIIGKCIAEAVVMNTPHKFAFVQGDPATYAPRMIGQTLDEAISSGSHVLLPIGDDHTLVLGGGGERILYHEAGAKLPKKHQLLLRFDDGTVLTVTVQGWGSVMLMTPDEIAAHGYIRPGEPDALDDDYDWDALDAALQALPPTSKASVKYALISDPGAMGIGNGVLQDILYEAGLHPRHRVVDLVPEQRQTLYAAIRAKLSEMVAGGGRDSDRDLFNEKGGYLRILHAKSKGTPCRKCGTIIEKQAYLGGSVYFCPSCQT